MVNKLIQIKREFSKHYSGSAHIQELIPTFSPTEIEQNHLELLHTFAKKNPIYFNSYEEKIAGINCTIYEGDINEYWLNSIKHGSSCQPFYPTWIISAYILALISKRMGFRELVDIGSGDGRISFCASIVGLDSHSIEIDDGLIALQKLISEKINQNFNLRCEDALTFDYSELSLTKPLFFIGGLPQMGGDILATGVIEKIKSLSHISKDLGMVFAGTNSKRQLSNNQNHGGWNEIITHNHLNFINTVSLPTVWTFDQESETPYIFTKFKLH
ncbi:hypothetical protein [Nitrosopumilus sp.]|uniref:hypothetical protein n=1 Tax=Nitrosopumilus sp. TaxID=2024843 RepID=UPI00345C4262